MAWTVLNFSVGEVLTAAKMNNLSANITAAMNGDSGAPSLEPASLHTAVTGTSISFATPTTGSQTGTTLAKVKEINVPYGGVFSVQFTLKTNDGAETVEGRIYVNGIAVGTNRTNTSTAGVEYTEDITLVAGDLLQVYARCTTSVFITATISNLKIRENTAYFFGELL